MGHGNGGVAFIRRGWFLQLLKLKIMAVIVFAPVISSEDQVGVPGAGLLCISNCVTCPVICSPPPPASTSPTSPPPPPPPTPVHHAPPPSGSVHKSPPPPPPPPSPPQPTPSPPQPTQSTPPPTPSWTPYSSWAAPPPPFNYLNVPSAPSPPGNGKNYSYPYYFFYASAAPLSHTTVASLLSFSLLLFFSYST